MKFCAERLVERVASHVKACSWNCRSESGETIINMAGIQALRPSSGMGGFLLEGLQEVYGLFKKSLFDSFFIYWCSVCSILQVF